MKNNKFVHKIKTAGVVAAAAFTMFACGNKRISENYAEIIKNKTDSAANANIEYRIATKLIDVCDKRVKRYHDINKDIVKLYAINYIAENMPDYPDGQFVINMIQNESLTYLYESDLGASGNVHGNVISKMNRICKGHSWFYDLMLYLTDKYDDKQFLTSDFFTVVNNPYVKKCFEHNVEIMDSVRSNVGFASERKNIIYKQLWNRYANEKRR